MTSRLGFFGSLLVGGFVVSACGTSHGAGEDAGGGVILPDGSFEDVPTQPDAGPLPDGAVVVTDTGSGRTDAGEPEPVCGNGDLEAGEGCDDNNLVDGDGCGMDCFREAFCGNDTLDGGEVCDDGNNLSGDGCRSDCLSDESCGNDIRDIAVGERCDDGNVVGGDGCSANCRNLEMCGDSTLDADETCDDGNTTGFDGCGSDCLTEQSMVLSELQIATAARGWDFSGDGRPDNQFASALGSAVTALNGFIDLGSGNPILLLHFLGLDDNTGVDDDSIRVGVLNGTDADANLDNNLGGSGVFNVASDELDEAGQPIVSLLGGISAAELTCGPEDIRLPLGFLPLTLSQAHVLGTTNTSMSGDLGGLDDGLMAGAISVQTLAVIPNPLETLGGLVGIPIPVPESCLGEDDSSTFADVLAGGANIFIATIRPTQPDVDIDGDGLERFILDEGDGRGSCQPVIVACVDGDGTRVDDRDCVFDARFVDGYSAAFNITAVNATIRTP